MSVALVSFAPVGGGEYIPTPPVPFVALDDIAAVTSPASGAVSRWIPRASYPRWGDHAGSRVMWSFVGSYQPPRRVSFTSVLCNG